MSQTTKPFFIVSSGRSGTAMLHKALSAVPGVEMHHEYLVHQIQPLAVRKYLGLTEKHYVTRLLHETYQAAIHFSDASHWGDSSNKVSWLIPELAEILPDAKFVHLVRDGRKVAGSYFRKLGAECYDDASTAALSAYYQDPNQIPPPPDKKFWWPVPRRENPIARDFAGFNQFERIAWHWAEINRVILTELARLPKARTHFVRLEDLRSDVNEARALYDFLNLGYRDEDFAAFARPHNVNKPEDRLLDAGERVQFERVAQAMMETLGYAQRTEYVVNY